MPDLRHPFFVRSMKITSPSNPRVKAAANLRNSRQRAEQFRFLIDGIREIGRALDGGIIIQEAFIFDDQCSSREAQQLLAQLEKSCPSHFEVNRSVYD